MPGTQFRMISFFPVLWLPSLAFSSPNLTAVRHWPSASVALEGWCLGVWSRRDRQRSLECDDKARSGQEVGNIGVANERGWPQGHYIQEHFDSFISCFLSTSSMRSTVTDYFLVRYSGEDWISCSNAELAWVRKILRDPPQFLPLPVHTV